MTPQFDIAAVSAVRLCYGFEARITRTDMNCIMEAAREVYTHSAFDYIRWRKMSRS